MVYYSMNMCTSKCISTVSVDINHFATAQFEHLKYGQSVLPFGPRSHSGEETSIMWGPGPLLLPCILDAILHVVVLVYMGRFALGKG